LVGQLRYRVTHGESIAPQGREGKRGERACLASTYHGFFGGLWILAGRDEINRSRTDAPVGSGVLSRQNTLPPSRDMFLIAPSELEASREGLHCGMVASKV
jgi:hypothetical protein